MRLRDGDRFWFERTFSGSSLAALERTTLSDVIRRNSETTNIQDNSFFFHVTISGQVLDTSVPPGRPGTGRGSAVGQPSAALFNSTGRAPRGLSGVSVQLLDDTGAVIATPTTDAGGFYLFDDLELGTYRVRLGADQGLTQTTPDPADISVTRSTSVRNVNIGVSTSQTVQPPVVFPRPRRDPVPANRVVLATDAVLSGFDGRFDRRLTF